MCMPKALNTASGFGSRSSFSYDISTGIIMFCNVCKSANQRSFKSEMAIAFREPENVNQCPLYTCQDIFVCLGCGHIERALPAEKVEQLEQALEIAATLKTKKDEKEENADDN
jgi:hypothetical protein